MRTVQRLAIVGAILAVSACQALPEFRLLLVSPPNGDSIPSSHRCTDEGTVQEPDEGTPGVFFSWTQIHNATSYRVDVEDASGALVGTRTRTGAGSTSACVPLSMTPGTYTWKVTALRQPPFPPMTSETWTFTIVP